MLGGAILAKIVTLPYASEDKADAMTLISGDLQSIVSTATLANNALFLIAEVTFGIYVLSILVGRSSFLVLIPTLGKLYALFLNISNQYIISRVLTSINSCSPYNRIYYEEVLFCQGYMDASNKPSYC